MTVIFFYCLIFFCFQSVSKNVHDFGHSSEAAEIVGIEPAVPPTPTVTIRVSSWFCLEIILLLLTDSVLTKLLNRPNIYFPILKQKPQPSTTTFVLNQLNQLPSLGTIVVTKPSVGSSSRQTITVTKVVQTPSSAQRCSSSSSNTATVCSVVPPNREQIKLKDLLRTSGGKTNSLGELMKLKPPPDIAQPVATATGTSESFCACNVLWLLM